MYIIIIIFIILLYASFLHQNSLIRCLINGKFPPIFWSLLGILIDLNDTGISKILILVMISNSISFFSNTTLFNSKGRTKCSNYYWYLSHPHVSQLFQLVIKVLVFIFLLSFIFTQYSAETTKFI